MAQAIIIGLGSDIGRNLATRYVDEGWKVWGTLRSESTENLPGNVVNFFCDLTNPQSINAAAENFSLIGNSWDILIVAAGTEEPIGNFFDCDEDDWDNGIQINTLAPLRLLRRLYPFRNQNRNTSVAFFSGSGTNNAAPSYSSYCSSKIMLIKMCELLNSECNDTSFFIIGPGIVRTKIHEQTIRVPSRAGENYKKVIDFLASDNSGTSHDEIYQCIEWCHDMGKDVVGGRNISLVYDKWRDGGENLAVMLKNNPNIYRLRRFGNEIQVEDIK